MTAPSFVLLYVSHPATSAAFYERLLGRPPVEASPTFVMFALGGGMMLGLWIRDGVSPASDILGGGGELAFTVGDHGAVDATCAAWAGQGVTIVQPPTDLDFGRAFLAVDPDGHRLRVFAPRG